MCVRRAGFDVALSAVERLHLAGLFLWLSGHTSAVSWANKKCSKEKDEPLALKLFNMFCVVCQLGAAAVQLNAHWLF